MLPIDVLAAVRKNTTSSPLLLLVHALVSWSDSLAVHCEDCHCTHSVCQYLVGLLSHTDTAAGGGIVDEFESQ